MLAASLACRRDAWAFGYQTDAWTELFSSSSSSDGPDPRSGHGCALVNEEGPSTGERTANLLVFGGMAKSRVTDSASLVNEVWRFAMRATDTSISGTWSLLQPSGSAPVPRFDHTSVAYEEGMLVYGGCESSQAFLDVWYLSPTGEDTYAWEALHLDYSPPPSMPMPLAPPSSPLSNGTVLSPSSPPPDYTPPSPSPPPPLPFWAATIPTAGARCAHSAVPIDGGMLVFGGRIPLPASRNGGSGGSSEPTWLTLTDGWIFSVERARSAASGEGTHLSGWWPLPIEQKDNGQTSEVAVNRSDHTCILRDGHLMLFGGLFTNIEENTIYIMKDFLNVDLPDSLDGGANPLVARQSEVGQLSRMQWGPAWRFLHSMVIATTIAHPDPRINRVLTNAPLLYGGGGGMEIFSDLWVYDHQESAWFALSTNEQPSAKVSIVTSLLFGTVGFGLYACVIVCVFIRRISRARQYGAWPPGQPQVGGQGGAPAGGPRRRAGAPPDMIDRLPRVSYADVVKLAGGECEDASGGSPPRGGAAASGGAATSGGAEAGGSGGESGRSNKAGTDDGEEGELCAVCLCEYEPDDMLIRLPCDHLFHEACVARWLQQDSSCPQCRFNLVPQPERASTAASTSADVEAGMEMHSRPIGMSLNIAAAPRPSAASQSAPAAAVVVATPVPIAEEPPPAGRAAASAGAGGSRPPSA